MEIQDIKPKSFWQKPEGITGMIFLAAVILGGGALLYSVIDKIVYLLQNTLYAALMLLALGAITYIILDPKFRNLIFFVYRSIMRFITGLFVKIDPIGIIETYIDTLSNNLAKMNTQIAQLSGQMRKLKDIINSNISTMKNDLALANEAKERGKNNIMILKSRKAGRLQDSNLKLQDLYKKMEVLYRVLVKMQENSEVLLEDIKDEVSVRKMEREAIRTSHSAMRSAISIIKGDTDKKQMFDQAMEAVADDVSRKVGEMERFMELSSTFMDSIDLQNGVYEEKGLELLDKWEKEGVSFLLGDTKDQLIAGDKTGKMLDVDNYDPRSVIPPTAGNQYKNLFKL